MQVIFRPRHGNVEQTSFLLNFRGRSSGKVRRNTVELMTRIELVTSPLPRECSTN